LFFVLNPGICHGPLSPANGKGSRQIIYGEDISEKPDQSGVTRTLEFFRATPCLNFFYFKFLTFKELNEFM